MDTKEGEEWENENNNPRIIGRSIMEREKEWAEWLD